MCVTICLKGVQMKKGKVNYIITQEFKTSKPNLTEKELKDIFNRKYFKYIMAQEKNLFNETDIKKNNTSKN